MTDVESDNASGSVFTRQWPEIRHVFQTPNLEHHVLNKTQCYVSEKLDGSNVAVTSNKVIASRRNILLHQPTDKELEKTKFSGQKLHKVAEMFPKLTKIQKTFSDVLSHELEVILYGELVQRGTATSTEDKFNYRSRGYEEGGFYIFGAGIALKENDNDIAVAETASKLSSLEYSPLIQRNDLVNRSYIVLLMNNKLCSLLSEHSVENIIVHQKMDLAAGLELYCEKLVINALEGIVVNFGDEILKWKGLDESYPSTFMEEIDQLLLKDSLKVVHGYIIKVAEEARRHWAHMKQERATLFLLEKAYKSALSKMKTLEDRKHEGEVCKEELDRFKTALEAEMSQDSDCDHFQEKLPAFIQSKMKSI